HLFIDGLKDGQAGFGQPRRLFQAGKVKLDKALLVHLFPLVGDRAAMTKDFSSATVNDQPLRFGSNLCTLAAFYLGFRRDAGVRVIDWNTILFIDGEPVFLLVFVHFSPRFLNKSELHHVQTRSILQAIFEQTKSEIDQICSETVTANPYISMRYSIY